jgi:hypothetical protein
MPRMRTSHQTGGALERARRAAAQAKPLAASTGAAAGRGVRRTRAWAAPQVERTGQVLQDSVAPAVAGLLSSVAQRLEPAKSRRRRWRKMAGISMLAAAAGAAAAAVLGRRKPDPSTSQADADTGDVTPASETSNRQARHVTDADADADARVRTS